MRPCSFRRTNPESSRRGFTLVEILVAIVLIEIGLLALTVSSGVVIREVTLARARVTALEMARNRVETLASAPCVAGTGNATSPNGFAEQWSAQLVPVATRAIRDSVTFTVQRVTRAVVLHTRTPCLQ